MCSHSFGSSYKMACVFVIELAIIYERRHEKTSFLHMQKQRRRSAAL